MGTELAERVADANAITKAGRHGLTKKTETVFEMLRSPAQQTEIARAVGDNITPERFTRVAVTLLRNSPALQACSPGSLMGALMICAQLGLEPGGPLGQAWLVPYKRKGQRAAECTFIVGYKGYIALALRSRDIASVKATAVYEGDRFSWTLGLREDLTHEPVDHDRDNPDKLTHTYAIARFRDRDIDPMFVVLTRAEIERFRARSRAKDDGPWKTDYVAMALKTAVRRLATWLPMAVDVARASSVDERTVERAHVDVDDYIDVDGEEITASGDTAVAEPDRPAGDSTEVRDQPGTEEEGARASVSGSATYDCDYCEGRGTVDDEPCAACDGTGAATPTEPE